MESSPSSEARSEAAGTPSIETLPNLRDPGGHRTRDGSRLRHSLVYRSVDLSRLDPSGQARLGDLGIRTVYDLRTAEEARTRPDRLPSGARRLELDVLADMTGAAPAQLTEVLEDPARAEEMFGGTRIETYFDHAYRQFVGSPSGLRSYRGLFRGLLEEVGRPALIHCTTGKDRTGWAAAALMLALGVSEDDVLRLPAHQ